MLLEGFDQLIVNGWPALTCSPPLGMLMALFEPCAAARAAQKARTRGAQGRIVALDLVSVRNEVGLGAGERETVVLLIQRRRVGVQTIYTSEEDDEVWRNERNNEGE